MDNFQVAIDATATAMDSAGSAMKENTSYMESLEAQTTQLKATFQDFANNVIDKELVSSILTLANDALGALNTETGSTITQWTLLTGVLTGGIVIYGQIAGKLLSAGPAVITLGKALSAGTATATMFTKAALPIAAAIGAIAVAGWKVYEWYKETHKSFQEYTDEVKTNNEQLEQNKQRIEEINKLSWKDKTPEIMAEKEALEKENEELQKQIDKLEKLSVKSAKRTLQGGYVESTQYKVSSSSSFGLGADTYLSEATFDTYDELVQYLNNYIPGASKKTREELEAMGIVFEEVTGEVYKTGDAYEQSLIQKANELSTKLQENHKLTEQELQDYQGITSKLGDVAEAHKYLGDNSNDAYNALNQLTSSYQDAIEYTDKYSNSVEISIAQVDAFKARCPELADQIVYVNGKYLLLSNSASSAADSLMSADGRIKKSSKDRTQSVLKDLQNLIDAYYSVVSTFAKAGTSSGITATQAKEANELARSLDAKKKQIQAAIYRSEKNGYYDDTLNNNNDPSLGTPKSSSTKTKQTTDEALKTFNNYYKDLQHQRQMDEIDDATYYKKLEELVAQYKANATAHMKEYGTDVDTINRNMYQYEEEIYNGLEKLQKESLEKQTEQLKEALEAQKKTWEDYKQNLEDQKDDMDAVASYAVEYASRQIDEIETELESIEDQIDAVNQKYDDQIKALEDANDELDKQIERERLLEDLASAKSKQRIVFKDGRFQYVSDVDEISSAQSAIDDFDRQQELEKQKAFIESQRENELEGLKNDEEILKEKKKRWEEYKDGWSNLTNDYEYEQNRLIATQQYGIEVEKGNWTARLNALEDFKSQYISKLKEIEAAQAKIDAISGAISVVSNSSKSSSTSGGSSTPSRKGPSKISSSVREAFRSALSKRYANGTLSASGGLSLVGENGPELRVLKPRSGIIPSDITRNLWNWGSIDPNILTSLCGSTTSYTFQIDKLSLPNVQDAKSLVEGLKNLAYQRAYKRA